MSKKINKISLDDNIILLTSDVKNIDLKYLSKEEIAYASQVLSEHKKETVVFDRLGKWVLVQLIKEEKEGYKRLENCRKAGDSLAARLNELKAKSVVVVDVDGKGPETLALVEGIALGSYQFLKYKSDKKEKENSLSSVGILSKLIKDAEIDRMNILTDSVIRCRTLVNEPVSHLSAQVLAKEFQKMGEEVGIKVEVLNKNKIEALKMGGLLAVNKGSADPPTFTIMEWNPPKPVNKKPVILVGKGVVFDTGGLNLKTANFMDNMKDDMAGAATMATVIYAIARLNLPLHVIGLMPATDNRMDANSIAPGDVIKMYDGTTVEVLNTDAEGRLILGDALSYAKKFKPELVIDAATLTGAASRAIGRYGIVAMENRAEKEMELLIECGKMVYERIAVFPFWEEYGELIKSDVADIKNIGGTDAGMITAGKFLAHFTDYPFIHLDIAGPAFIEKKDSYRTAGGTGFGVRLLVEFLEQRAKR
ncbi:MAG: leucyl aminopeptidase [Bacteroidales bacterium]|nr:leucyl aminopeptidase [Bacteroidales bacterium]